MPLDQKRNSRNDKPLQTTLSQSKPSILIKYAVNIRFIFHGEIIATPKTIYKCCILPLTTSSSENLQGNNINSVYSQFSGINFAMKLCSEILKNYILKLCRWNSMRSSIHYTLNMHTVFSCNKKKVIEFFALHVNTFKMIPNHISFDKYWCCFTSFQTKKKLKYIG